MQGYVGIEEREKRFYDVLDKVRFMEKLPGVGNISIDVQTPAPRKDRCSGYVYIRVIDSIQFLDTAKETLFDILKEEKQGFGHAFGSKVIMTIKHEKDYTTLEFCIPDVFVLSDVDPVTKEEAAEALGMNVDEL